jgi:3-oxoadipate enol-lactonase
VRTVAAGTVDLHVETHGVPDGPAVVLLHGLGSSARDWGLQIPALADRYRVIAPDLRGHGRTPRGRGWPTIGAMADDVRALLDRRDAPAAHVVGLSLGACVGLALALGAPSRVRSLTLVNGFARLRLAGARGALRVGRRLGLLLCAPMRTTAACVARELFPGPHQRGHYEAAVASLAANRRRDYLATMRALRAFDVVDALPGVACPTLVVAGAGDRTVPLAAKQRLAAAIPGARLVVVADSGHATNIDQAAPFNRLLRDFLDAREEPG